jgi:membrane-bound lytic murein transglycosylase B
MVCIPAFPGARSFGILRNCMRDTLYRSGWSTLLSVIILFFTFVSYTYAETDSERRARLERELQVVEQQIIGQQQLVRATQAQRQTLERDIKLIEGEIRQAQLGIQARSISIKQLSDEIGEKEEVINILDYRLTRQQQSVADLVRKSAAVEDTSLVELFLLNKSFSDFYSDMAQFQAIKKSLNESMVALQMIKRETAEQKEVLYEKQLTEAEMKIVQELQKKDIEQKEREKENILKVTKGQEAEYQRILQSQQQTASQLRSALFQLLGGGGGIPLPEAVRLSKYAEGKTGVQAALILAILEQETNLGSNLGSCSYNDMRGGRPVMHPDRDAPVFLAIGQILGFNPSTQVVSCPLMRNGAPVGWGGAMGPSQFIPSTWAMYGGIVNTGNGWVYQQSSDAIRRVNGGTGPANPWNNQDAFLATALLLRDNGANGTFAGDRTAALRYYAGWGGANNPANAFYGDQVMNRKAKFEGQIRILGGN